MPQKPVAGLIVVKLFFFLINDMDKDSEYNLEKIILC